MSGFDFKALAERAATVKVGGKPVHLRLPDPAARKAVIDAIASPEGADPREAVHKWNLGCGKALAATVVEQDGMTEEDWSRVATAQGTEHDEDIQKLVVAAMGLCGFKAAMDAMADAAKDPDSGVTDHVADADTQAGNSPTK